MSPSWHAATLTDRSPAGGGLTRVVLAASRVVSATYVNPGQYVNVRVGEATGYFVLSGDPGASSWDLVMRAGGGASDVLLVMPVPGSVEVTPAIGDGFPVSRTRGRDVLVALGGTGIAAGPPVVRRRIREGDAHRTHVWVGARGADLPLAAEIQSWREAGVAVHVTSQFLDEAMRAHIVASPEAPVFAVGAEAMVEALRAVAPGRVHVNH